MKDYLSEYQTLIELHNEKRFSIEQLSHDGFVLWLKTPFAQKEYQTTLETFKTAKLAKFDIINENYEEVSGYLPTQIGENDDLGIKYYLFLGEYPDGSPDFQGLVSILASRLSDNPELFRDNINKANFNQYADIEYKLEQYRALAKSRSARLPSTYKEFLERIEQGLRSGVSFYSSTAKDKREQNLAISKEALFKMGITDYSESNIRKFVNNQDKKIIASISLWEFNNDLVRCLEITAKELEEELAEIHQEQVALSSSNLYEIGKASIYKEIKSKPKTKGVDKDETAPSGSIKRAYFLWPELEEVTSGIYFDQEMEYNRAYGNWKKDRQEWLDKISAVNKELRSLRDRQDGLASGLVLDTSSTPERTALASSIKEKESELETYKKGLGKVDDRVNDLSLNVFTYAGKVYHNTNGNLIYRYVGGEYPGLPPQDNESLVEIFDHDKAGESIVMTKGDAFYFGTRNTKVDALFTSVLGEIGSTGKRNESQALNDDANLSEEEKQEPSTLFIDNKRAELIIFGTQEGGRAIKRSRQALNDIVPRLFDISIGIPQSNGTKVYYRMFDSKKIEYGEGHNPHKCIGLNLARSFVNDVILPNKLYYRHPTLYYRIQNQVARELMLFASQQLSINRYATNFVNIKVSTIMESLPSLHSYETYKESGRRNFKRDVFDRLKEGIDSFNKEAKGAWIISGDYTDLNAFIRIERIEPTDLVKLPDNTAKKQ